MSPLLSWALLFALGCLSLAMMFALVRMILGPRAEDRVLAFDCLYLNTTLVILTLGLLYRSSAYFEAALLIALFGFVGSSAMAKFLLRGEIIE
jgi:multicomponent K+:H+ antiporter subunit F